MTSKGPSSQRDNQYSWLSIYRGTSCFITTRYWIHLVNNNGKTYFRRCTRKRHTILRPGGRAMVHPLRVPWEKWSRNIESALYQFTSLEFYFMFWCVLSTSFGFTFWRCFNTLRPSQNGRHFPDDIFKCIFSWTKMYKFRSRFHWNLFARVQLTIFQNWFR